MAKNRKPTNTPAPTTPAATVAPVDPRAAMEAAAKQFVGAHPLFNKANCDGRMVTVLAETNGFPLGEFGALVASLLPDAPPPAPVATPPVMAPTDATPTAPDAAATPAAPRAKREKVAPLVRMAGDIDSGVAFAEWAKGWFVGADDPASDDHPTVTDIVARLETIQSHWVEIGKLAKLLPDTFGMPRPKAAATPATLSAGAKVTPREKAREDYAAMLPAGDMAAPWTVMDVRGDKVKVQLPGGAVIFPPRRDLMLAQ